MKLLIGLVLTMILPSIASAAEVTQQLGPYMVSFNMNTNMNYSVQVLEPMQNPMATIYSMVIATNNETGARVSIADSSNLTDATIATNGQFMACMMANQGLNATPSKMVIDGKPGYVVTGVSPAGAPKFTIYQAGYWPDGVDCECGPVSVGKNSVAIASSYPDDITQGILSSIHVEKG